MKNFLKKQDIKTLQNNILEAFLKDTSCYRRFCMIGEVPQTF